MYLGIDIGGTKTLLGRFSKSGKLEESVKFPTPRDFKDFSKLLSEGVDKITTKKWNLACVAAPGRLDREKGMGIRFGNLPWKNVPLRDTVSSLIGTKVLIENDAKVAALYEARQLKKPRHKVLYLTISTGIGAGVVTNNVIDEDLRDIESGHMLLEHNGKLVIWESFASGKAIVKRFNKRAADIDDKNVWKLISHDIAYGLIDVIANIQPDIAIIGGGVGSHFKKFGEYLKDELEKYASDMVKIPPVVAAKRPEEAVIYGCYELMSDARTS